jgi:hypothetical protein
MYKNSDYENANSAIHLIKNGLSIIDAAEKTNSNAQIINIMLSNEEVLTEDVFVEDTIKTQRQNICSTCDKNKNNTCMECACPLPVILNMKFKECPLGKW